MDIPVAQVAAVAAPAVAVIVWLVRLEGRQNTHEKECEQRNKNADERHDAVTLHLSNMDSKLDRLVDRLL